MKNIRDCEKVVVAADKSNNLYKIDKNEYETYLSNNITSDYRKANPEKAKDIDKGAFECAKKLGLANRMELLQTSESYVTIKDHKEDFHSKPSFRLINPSKTDKGRVSKQLLDDINKELLSRTGVNQWNNTHSVIEWFKESLIKKVLIYPIRHREFLSINFT